MVNWKFVTSVAVVFTALGQLRAHTFFIQRRTELAEKRALTIGGASTFLTAAGLVGCENGEIHERAMMAWIIKFNVKSRIKHSGGGSSHDRKN